MTDLQGARIGCAMTGSFCTFSKAFAALRPCAQRAPNYIPLCRTTPTPSTRVSAAQRICGGDWRRYAGAKFGMS